MAGRLTLLLLMVTMDWDDADALHCTHARSSLNGSLLDVMWCSRSATRVQPKRANNSNPSHRVKIHPNYAAVRQQAPWGQSN